MFSELFRHQCQYREQVESLQGRISQLEALVAELTVRLEQLEKENRELKTENAELKAKLAQYEHPKDSSNSSIPPSQDRHRRKYARKEKSERPAGGQKGHPGHHHPWHSAPDEIVTLHPEQCSHCGSQDIELSPHPAEARQEVEIAPIHPFVREFRAAHGQCRQCGKLTRALFPDHVKGHVQISQSVEALVLYLKTTLHASHDKITHFLNRYLHLSVSHGWIHLALKRSQKRLLPLYQQLIERLKQQPKLHSDETGCPVGGKTQWLWVFAAEDLFVYVAATSRGFSVIQETIGNTFSGTWISDRLAAQLKITAMHQICLAHIIRECKWLIEAEHSQWALHLRTFLQKVIHARNDSGEQWKPDNEEIKQQVQRYQDELNTLLSTPPPEPKKEEKKSKALILCEQLNIHKDKILHFLHNPIVPPTNNLAEQALRGFVAGRKMNGGFKTPEGAQDHAVFLSIVHSAIAQGKDIFQVLSLKQPLFQPV
jgi:transposase